MKLFIRANFNEILCLILIYVSICYLLNKVHVKYVFKTVYICKAVSINTTKISENYFTL